MTARPTPSMFRARAAGLVLLAGAALLGWSAPAAAQGKPAKPVVLSAVGVFSLLGDSVQVAAATEAPTDTRIERTARESLNFKGIGFDRIALRATRDAIRAAQPAAAVSLFQSPEALTPLEQRSVAEGARQGGLPGWMVQTIEANKLSHVIVITRGRGPMDSRTMEGYDIGRGTVEGIGFFMDTLYTMKNDKTGALSTGLLAPYVQIRLTLMDTQTAEVVASYDIRDSFAYASPETQVKADPWSFMPAEEKVRVLRDLVDKGVVRGSRALLQPG